MGYICDSLLIVIIFIALYTDIKYNKIYNKLTLPAIFFGFILNSYFSGWPGLIFSLKGFTVAFGIVLVLFAFRAIGGGDAKLILAIGTLKGMMFVLYTLLFTVFAAGLLAIIVMLRRRILSYSIKNLARNFYSLFILKLPTELAAGTRGGKLPYSVAVAAGTLSAWLVIHYLS